MIIRHLNSGFGRTVKMTEETAAGQIIRLSFSEGDIVASKVSTTADADGDIAVAFKDMTTGSRQTLYNASLTSKEHSIVAADGNMVALTGDLILSTDQFADGNYQMHDPLTIDWTTAMLKKAGEGDTIYGRVLEPGVVASQDRMIKFKITIGMP